MYSTKAVTYNERPKMKRDVRQKSSPFLRKSLFFCQAYLFIFGNSSYVTALESLSKKDLRVGICFVLVSQR